ncbi:MAG TPA: four helix bundle protein [Thermoanaerobaculia bacterium]|nr:four helix bundle protein [Thermoanaerobaculia bacterium]
MSKSGFVGLDVWQKARLLAKDIYVMTRSFPREEIFGLTQQMRRAAVSILCNIAEGRGRRSRPDYRHFVLIARGSAFELQAQIIIASDIGYVEESTAKSLSKRAAEVARMLSGLVRYLDHPPQSLTANR